MNFEEEKTLRGLFRSNKNGHEFLEKFATSFANGGNVPDKMKGTSLVPDPDPGPGPLS